MNWVSLLGLLTLLFIAWLLSSHRRRIQYRTVAWGIGLQFLFALILLREDAWSFAGMGVLAGLLITYMLGSSVAARGSWVVAAAGLAGAAAVAALFHFVLPGAIPGALIVVTAFLLLNARFAWVAAGQRWLGSAFVALGVAFFTSRGLYGQVIFASLSGKVAAFLNLSEYGARFLFANLTRPEHFFTPEGSPWPGFGFQFAFVVLPTIIFFGGFMAVLYHLGVMQKVIEALARFMRWTMRTSGAETLSCTANIFVGQTEAPLLIRPFLDRMTRSELLTVMVGGFATIAGGVLAGYIAFGVPAGHLIAASVMSAPAALAIGKMLYPETEHSETAGDVKLPQIEAGGNLIEAASNGITDGLKLAVNVGAMLLGFIALIAVVDVLLNWMDGMIDGRWLGGEYVEYAAVGLSPATGEFLGWFPGSLQTLFGTVLRPLAWLMGVPWKDATLIGNLLGVKLSLNEFVAFGTLGTYIQGGVISERAIIIATYALCGFANFSSIGIQIGGISAVAPRRKGDLAAVGLKAMFGGAIASWTTATIAGMLLV